ncbi:MAG TPA: NAD(P)H-binding protein, partial [bacterium]
MNPNPLKNLILLTGATGYVGGRLLKVLLEKSCRIRCMARKPEYLKAKLPPSVEVVAGDVGQPDSLGAALEGVQTAYYLVHSMNNNPDYEEADRRAAENFGRAAKSAGVQKIIYLGGLGSSGNLSPHLRSRQEVGRILRASGVPTVEFQASIIIGSGSFSFEMIRALVERLPVMVTPRWVQTLCQPIAINDVISYLSEALVKDFSQSRVFPIGGMKAVSYGNLMREYARQRGLRRFMIPVPFLTPRLSSLWLGLVTPVYAQVGRQLIEGLRYETVVNDPSALAVFSVKPLGVEEAIRQALGNED